MNKSFINNIFFRIFFPLFYGLLVYLLVLMIFDTINQLNQNFFSIEAILCILITTFFSESSILIVKIIDKKIDVTSVKTRITTQVLVSIASTFLITTLIVSAYMYFLLGFKSFFTELLIFNTIFGISTLAWQGLWFSLFFVQRSTYLKLKRENELRENIRKELENYKKRIKPTFLFESFEKLIILQSVGAEQADSYINNLSQFYRKILKSNTDELVSLEKEVKSFKEYLTFLNDWHNYNTKFFNNLPSDYSFKLVPNTLIAIYEYILEDAIKANEKPIIITLKTEENSLKFEASYKQSLQHKKNILNDINALNKAYNYFTEKNIEIDREKDVSGFTVPMVFENEIHIMKKA